MPKKKKSQKKNKNRTRNWLRCDSCGCAIVCRPAASTCPCKKALYCSPDCASRGSFNHGIGQCDVASTSAFPLDSLRQGLGVHVEDNLDEVDSQRIQDSVHGLPKDPGDLERHAKAGNLSAQYFLGIMYKNRINIKASGKGKEMDFGMKSKYFDKSRVLTDRRAIYWLRKAAKRGHTLAMESLIQLLNEEKDQMSSASREAIDWCELAYNQTGSSYALECLREDTLLVKEIIASHGALSNFGDRLRGRSVGFNSPNLAALCLVGGNLLKYSSQQKFPVDYWAEKMSRLIRDLGTLPVFEYGRAGSFKNATAAIQHPPPTEGHSFYSIGKPRASSSALQSPCSVLDSCIKEDTDLVSSESADDASPTNPVSPFDWSRLPCCIDPFACAHFPDNPKSSPPCQTCIIDGESRLKAALNGHFALSITLDEELYGFTALFWKAGKSSYSSGSICSERFKTYSKIDMDTVLKVLARENRVDMLSPTFIARDPNYFWPLIYYYGSISRALDSCVVDILNAESLDMCRMEGDRKEAEYENDGNWCSLEEREAVSSKYFPKEFAGSTVRRCSAKDCYVLETTTKLRLCAKCEIVAYCGEDCQRKDWARHKPYCSK